ncbi:hypothetical protein Ms3S1_36130 [Methylosinus sp. 3S-1]|uniref:Uncharacterized protein n=1 Tax=Methylosinus trichosporium (strain ATCC 35070 / NCIMB 11131 / UNIQEM 75 / OB3b) TaxID=595536 RepID=A0A2D2D3T4_METT3|nr:hypothetical protein CQW49_18290 [Methylosinus trichosporium OB3b]OBS52017.1 hypothetical protein A8B73_13255 [Methylosinus sp. 3S-1]
MAGAEISEVRQPCVTRDVETRPGWSDFLVIPFICEFLAGAGECRARAPECGSHWLRDAIGDPAALQEAKIV